MALSERIAFLASITRVIDANVRHKDSFFHVVCKETFSTGNIVMFFPKNFYLIEAINKKISEFQASGIIQHLVERYMDKRYWNFRRVAKGPERISFQHMQGSFIMWLFLCLASFSVFTIEVIFHAVRLKHRRTLYKTQS